MADDRQHPVPDWGIAAAAEALRAVPEGTKVAVVGTANYTDHEQAFEKLDANGDGFVSPREAEGG